jgi:exonuclease III
MNKRGCAVLLKKSLNCLVHARRDDPEENYLLLRISLQGKTFIVGSIYGPNTNNPLFFDNLNNDLRSLGNYPIILAGDWNCTYSSDPLNSNIDCINMRNLPNPLHSQLIDDLCNELTLEDPYRSLNPAKVDFTYIPRAAGKNNRS